MPSVQLTSTGPGTLYVGTTSGNSSMPIEFTNADVWSYWNATGTTSSTLTLSNLTWTAYNTAYEETREQREERERQQAEARARAEARAAEIAQQYVHANARAEALLLEFLSDEQAASRRARGFFAVHGSRSGAVYRIHNTGISGNVDRLGTDGRREMTFCCHPPGQLPAGDVHLAQMLALVTDEDEFLRVANARRVHYADPVPVQDRPQQYEAPLPVAA